MSVLSAVPLPGLPRRHWVPGHHFACQGACLATLRAVDALRGRSVCFPLSSFGGVRHDCL